MHTMPEQSLGWSKAVFSAHSAIWYFANVVNNWSGAFYRSLPAMTPAICQLTPVFQDPTWPPSHLQSSTFMSVTSILSADSQDLPRTLSTIKTAIGGSGRRFYSLSPGSWFSAISIFANYSISFACNATIHTLVSFTACNMPKLRKANPKKIPACSGTGNPYSPHHDWIATNQCKDLCPRRYISIKEDPPGINRHPRQYRQTYHFQLQRVSSSTA